MKACGSEGIVTGIDAFDKQGVGMDVEIEGASEALDDIDGSRAVALGSRWEAEGSGLAGVMGEDGTHEDAADLCAQLAIESATQTQGKGQGQNPLAEWSLG